MPRNDFINTDGTINYDNIASKPDLDTYKKDTAIYVESYFNAVEIDSTGMIQRAMNDASGKRLFFKDGKTYTISSEITAVANVSLYGKATLKALTRIRSFIYVGAVAGVEISELTFDMGQSVLPTYVQADYDAAVNVGSGYNQAVYAYQSSDIKIHDCTFTNLYTKSLMFYQCSGLVKIFNNKFLSPVQVQKILADHVWFQTCSSDIQIQNNIFDNTPPSSPDFGVTGVYTSGLTGTLSVSDNTFKYCGRNSVGGHQLGSFSSYGDVAQGDIHHNRFLNNLQQVIRLTLCHHMNVHHNYCTMASVAGDNDQIVSIEGTITFGVAPFGCDDIKVHHNTFIDAYAANRTGVSANAYDWGYPLKDIQIHNNLFVNCKYIIKLSGAITRLSFNNNNAVGPNGNIIQYLYTTQTPTETYGTQVASFIRDLTFKMNTQDGTGTVLANPIYLNFIGYTGNIGKIEIDDNTIQNSTSLATQAIVFRGVAGKGQIIVRKNKINNYDTVFDLVTGDNLVLEENSARNWTPASPINISAFTTMTTRGNLYSAQATQGTARLVAGTVTVNTTEVLTGDVIQLTRVVSDGSALGHLSLGTITNKTSFVINSSSATDTTFIYWEIRH